MLTGLEIMVAGGATLPADTVQRESRVVVRLPAAAGRWNSEIVGSLRPVAWVPGVAVVVADMTSLVTWDDGCLEGLLQAHRDLASRSVELRLVVWSPDLYAAVHQRAGRELPVYASVYAALRGP